MTCQRKIKVHQHLAYWHFTQRQFITSSFRQPGFQLLSGGMRDTIWDHSNSGISFCNVLISFQRMAPTFAKGAVMSPHTSSTWGRRGRGHPSLLWYKSYLFILTFLFTWSDFQFRVYCSKQFRTLFFFLLVILIVNCHMYVLQLSFLPFLAFLCIWLNFVVISCITGKAKVFLSSRTSALIFRWKICSTPTLSVTGSFGQQYLFVESCQRKLIFTASPFTSSTTFPK